MEESLKTWWAVSLEKVFQALGTSREGLSQEEGERRVHEFGSNELAKRKRITIIERFLSKFSNPLILLLLFAALLSAVLGQLSDFLIIAAITLVSITIDVVQEHQAVEGAEKLRKRVSLTATVLRDGKTKEIPLLGVVPGDVVLLSVGDIVPGDGRLITAYDFLIDQSALTGESFPQQKNSLTVVGPVATVAERTNSVFMGTNVIAGEGTAVIVTTGGSTELGKVAEELVAKRPQTEFEKGITDFGYLLAKTALIFAAGVFISHMFLGHDLLSSLLFVLALAIGFAPELLPIVITINLSKGALRMSGQGVIVKSLPSIENFGSMDILATDKTGTITENAISLSGFEDFTGKEAGRVLELGFVTSIFQTGFSGPMEEAVKARARGSKVTYEKVETIPFDFYRKRLSVIVRRDKHLFLIVKGAPEEIISLSDRYELTGKVLQLTPAVKKKADKHFAMISERGFRTLAIAYKKLDKTGKKFTASDEKALIYVGLLIFEDPAKKTATEALTRLVNHGIAIKIITGDNELVTEKICRDIGLAVKGVLVGSEMEKITDAELQKKVEGATIFARINPTLKERIIGALRKNGHVVGFLGDGINDAPSLRAADIGISVNNAVDVAKETADIILLHKDLHVLASGAREGRITFGNVMKYLKMGLSSNFGNMMSLAFGSVILPFLPMLPVQVLLNNLLYDISQLLLASDNVDVTFLAKPRKWDVRSLRTFMVVFGPANSIFDLITFALLLWFFHASIPFFQTGWFVENVVAQTLIVFAIRTSIVPFFKSRISPIFASSLIVITVIVLVLPLSPFGRLFSFVPLPALFYPALGGIVLSYFLLVELIKRWFYSRYEV